MTRHTGCTPYRRLVCSWGRLLSGTLCWWNRSSSAHRKGGAPAIWRTRYRGRLKCTWFRRRCLWWNGKKRRRISVCHYSKTQYNVRKVCEGVLAARFSIESSVWSTDHWWNLFHVTDISQWYKVYPLQRQSAPGNSWHKPFSTITSHHQSYFKCVKLTHVSAEAPKDKLSGGEVMDVVYAFSVCVCACKCACVCYTLIPRYVCQLLQCKLNLLPPANKR